MQEADAVGLFSFYEGFPNVVCEGMAMGKVVVASKISDNAQFILNSNLLSDPSKPQSICNSLKHLQKMNELDLIEEGNKNAELSKEKFNKESIIENYLFYLKK